MRRMLTAFVLLALAATAAETWSAPTHQSGYEDLSDFGGPESVNRQIRDADATRPSLSPVDDALAGYFD